MEIKGVAVIRPSIKMEDCVVGAVITEDRFNSIMKKSFHPVMDIAVDKSSVLILIDKPAALIDIPRKHIAFVFPFYKDQDGHIIPTEFDLMQKAMWKSVLIRNIELITNNPIHQVTLLYQTYPEFWEREQKGEFFWSGF